MQYRNYPPRDPRQPFTREGAFPKKIESLRLDAKCLVLDIALNGRLGRPTELHYEHDDGTGVVRKALSATVRSWKINTRTAREVAVWRF